MIDPADLDTFPDRWPFSHSWDVGHGMVLSGRRTNRQVGDQEIPGDEIRFKLYIPRQEYLNKAEQRRLRAGIRLTGPTDRRVRLLARLAREGDELAKLAQERHTTCELFRGLDEATGELARQAADHHGRPARITSCSIEDCRWWRNWLRTARHGL